MTPISNPSAGSGNGSRSPAAIVPFCSDIAAQVELEKACADRPLQTVECFSPNDFYGNATLLKRYAELPPDFVIRAVMPHGPSVTQRLWKNELTHPIGHALAISAQQRELYRRQCNKTVDVIGSPLFYAERLLGDTLQNLRRGAGGTIVFPTHSTHHVTAQYDQDGLVQSLRNLPPEFHPIHVCLYWRDIQLGRHRRFLEAGFPCTTAGHMFDPAFPFRLLQILATHQRAVVNRPGSTIYYAAAFGLPVVILAQDTRFTGPDSRYLAELSPKFDLPAVVEFLKTTLDLPLAEAALRQKRIAWQELGREAVLGPEQLRELLNRLPALPAEAIRPATPAKSTAPVQTAQPKTNSTFQPQNGFTIETTIDSLVPSLRPVVARHPRRQPGWIKLDGRPLAYADLHSLYHQAQQIFGQKLYDFHAATEHPMIVDGGAHIGLAALYFARRYPAGTILAFEADPRIAELLAANVAAFGLNNVQAQPRALWISNDGVEFAATADDSGHVVAPDAISPANDGSSPVALRPATRGYRVPSLRLRELLLRQPIDLLKLDIEGAEFAVLRDCDGALDRVQNILLEVHRFRDADGCLGELLQVLERNGFDYALGDLHAATWIDSPERPPFAACPSRHYIVSVFAWRPAKQPSASRPSTPDNSGSQQPASPAGPPTAAPAVDAVLREAVQHLNGRREADALRNFDRAIARGPCGPRVHFGRSLALARLGRTAEAGTSLANLLRQDPTHAPAAALAAELAQRPNERLYVASYPRSGNTWMRLLLADLILQQHGYQTGTTLPIHADHIIPDLHTGKASDVDRRLRLKFALLKSHDRFDRLEPGRAICIFRQAADSLVSYYHFHRRYPHLAAKAADGIEKFCRAHVAHWKAHLQSFLDARRGGANILFVSYEALHADPSRVLLEVARFVGLSADDKMCRQAAANHAFDKRQAAERQAHGEKYAVPFFRQGRVNGAAAELAADTWAALEAETKALYVEARALELSLPQSCSEPIVL